MSGIVVVGQVARDLVLRIDTLPEAGRSAPVKERRELLGGKGANQAVACSQLGVPAALVGVVGDDGPGRAVLDQARDDGLDVDAVVRRPGGTTALLVDVVEQDATRRLLEHVPPEVLLTADDVRRAAAVFRGADYVLLQLQQPGEAVLAALDLARDAGVPVLADGATEEEEVRDALLRCARVLRADAAEAQLLTGRNLEEPDEVADAARELVAAGPSVVALAAGSAGNVVAWHGGCLRVPLTDAPVTDPTGAGDAFVAALAVSLLHGAEPPAAAWAAGAAAALTVARLGGRPDLHPEEVAGLADRMRREAE